MCSEAQVTRYLDVTNSGDGFGAGADAFSRRLRAAVIMRMFKFIHTTIGIVFGDHPFGPPISQRDSALCEAAGGSREYVALPWRRSASRLCRAPLTPSAHRATRRSADERRQRSSSRRRQFRSTINLSAFSAEGVLRRPWRSATRTGVLPRIGGLAIATFITLSSCR